MDDRLKAKLRAMGKTRFVLIFGVLIWGSLSFFVATHIVMPLGNYLFGAESSSPPPKLFSPRFWAHLIGDVLIWGTVGYVNGVVYWKSIINR